ncbi:hypothetical protein diail_9728 [Diaporthe ilicicola]|nr:hypothetical protein diail_9728 [Diaporthe ilicicola]
MSSAAEVIACGCGKRFLSEAALEQHRRDRVNANPASMGNNPCVKKIKGPQMPKSATKNIITGPQILNPKERWLARGAGGLVDTLASVSLEPPGGAPVFEAIPLPITVKPDSGRQFVDQNAAKVPNHPFEVVFQAAEMMNPTVRFDEVDVLTNRNSLRKFFDFCKGRAQDSFRVNLHLVNDTLIIERCVRSTTEFLQGSAGSGFGHNFEKAVTRFPPGLEDSSGHHRVLRYDVGGLKCAVRFEVDAFYNDPETTAINEDQIPKVERHNEDVESLAMGFTSMVVDRTSAASTDGSAHTLRRGAGTAQAGVAELKSRKDHRPKPKAEWLPQLWFGRTRYLVTGHHDHGIFLKVHTRDLKEELEAWEKTAANQEALQKMAALLSRLRDIVRTIETKACVVICEKSVRPPTLQIHTSTSGKRALPESVVKKFWNTGAH